MAGRLRQFRDRENLNDEQFRELASERLGYDVKQATIDSYLDRRKLPLKWIDAFGLEPNAEPEFTEAPPYEPPLEPGTRRLREDEAPEQPTLERAPSLGYLDPKQSTVAKERLKAIHGMVGHGAAVALRSPGIDRVTEDFAPLIAEAWVQAAGEVAWARWLVDSISVGGAAGELVSCYMLWIGGILYIQGTIPSLGLYDKYSAHRGSLPAAAPAGGAGGEPNDGSVESANGSASPPAGWDPTRPDSGATMVSDPASPGD